MGNLKFKNLVYIAFIIFVFGISFNFVSAGADDGTCRCTLNVATCIDIKGIIKTDACASEFKSCNCSVSAVSTTTASGNRGTGGLVPCTDDCTADDLFGTAGSYASNPPIWSSLIRTALGISGIFILLMFVYGGVMIIVSRGDKAKIKKATDIMKNSIVGLLIVIFAYTFVKFIVIALVNEKWTLFFGGQ